MAVHRNIQNVHDRKKYLMFEQKWFSHIEQYFTVSTSASNVLERANMSGANIPVKDQRIIVSTLAYHIHDIIVEHVKDFKESLDASTESSSFDVNTETIKLKFYESKTSFLRYGGFALHSMIKKRTKYVQATSLVKNELKVLESLKATVTIYHQQYTTFNRVDFISSLLESHHYCEQFWKKQPL